MPKCNRSFTIDKEISKKFDDITKKIKERGVFWQQKNLEFKVSNGSNLVEFFILSGINEIEEILEHDKN